MKKVMEECDLYNSVFLLQPSRPILCTTKNEDDSDHVAPFSWINPASHKPPRVALALMNKPQKQKSLQNIERTGEFVVNLPDLGLAEKLVQCSFSSKFGENKFDRSCFTRMPSVKVKPNSIAECRAHLECKAISLTDAGDHTLIIADILCARYDDDAYSSNLLINTLNFRPLVHLKGFNLEKSQLHVFLSSEGSRTIEISYPQKKCDK